MTVFSYCKPLEAETQNLLEHIFTLVVNMLLASRVFAVLYLGLKFFSITLVTRRFKIFLWNHSCFWLWTVFCKTMLGEGGNMLILRVLALTNCIAYTGMDLYIMRTSLNMRLCITVESVYVLMYHIPCFMTVAQWKSKEFLEISTTVQAFLKV